MGLVLAEDGVLLPCRVVRVTCGSLRPYQVVEPGMELGRGCRVTSAKPTPCVASPLFTRVERVEAAELEVEELQRNVVVRLYRGDSRRSYVYPKHVWERVSLYMEAIARGEAPPEPGLLLYGPPGTGKTSMAEILADVLGVHTVTIDQSILSMWLGESEANLRDKLDEAESQAPSLVIADEGEWLLARRNLAGGGPGASAERVYADLVATLLRRLQEWKNRRLPVLMVVATNYSIKAIDPAFLRSGRFGEPLLVPPPDLEAIRAMLREMGVYEKLGEAEADKLARRLAAIGANMADVVAAAEAVLKGGKPRLSPFRNPGYRRVTPYEVPDEKKLKQFAAAVRCIHCKGRDGGPSKTGRYYLAAPFYTGVALAAYWLIAHGYTPILVYSHQRIEEAAHMAESGQSALMVATDMIVYDEVLTPLIDTQAPVIFIGKRQPKMIPAARLELSNSAVRVLREIISSFYGIEVKMGLSPNVDSIEEMIAANLAML